MAAVRIPDAHAGYGAGPSIPVTESFDRARLDAMLRACRTLRHDLATPLSAAGLHLEVVHRAVLRGDGAVPKIESGLATALAKVEEASRLLDALTLLGDAHSGEPGIVDFGALALRAAQEAVPQLEALGLELRAPEGAEGVFVLGFGDELGVAFREALLAGARWARAGEAVLQIDGLPRDARFSFRLPRGEESPGERLFRAGTRPGAGFTPFAARWTFEAHGGRLEGTEEGGFLTVTGSVPRVAR